jgi:hypothetical protein
MTLKSVRGKYLYKDVVLVGETSHDLSGKAVLLSWDVASESAGRYQDASGALLPAEYKGRVATVIAIQLHDPVKQGKVNALGDLVNPDDIEDPYLDLVVWFDDNEVAIATTYPLAIPSLIRFESAQNALRQEMATKLPAMIGKPIYACSYSHLYKADATLDELLGSHRILKEISGVPFLAPLNISGAKFWETEDAVVLKVRMPDGTEGLTIASGEQLTDSSAPFVERASGSLLAAIPAKLTPHEIEAIKKEKVFRGMSKDALYCSMGYPESTNNWGRGGKQLIYSQKIMVYLDNQNKVEDWQALGDK